ncbi:PREDICTED: uncharacterized protein LOC104704025 [Camelina sativa]|uniref:Uncharacterized protein LOC104704025 n=1 Tax=Camelina sativa TaxID=90675 RepID=A0ABM0SZM2_CAMSA|nr:PREDICTED: uncharacterized protein LOC104704025 [Camelina sativa]
MDRQQREVSLQAEAQELTIATEAEASEEAMDSKPVTISQLLGTYVRRHHEYMDLRIKQLNCEEVPAEEKEKGTMAMEKMRVTVNETVRGFLEDYKDDKKKVETMEKIKDGIRKMDKLIEDAAKILMYLI